MAGLRILQRGDRLAGVHGETIPHDPWPLEVRVQGSRPCRGALSGWGRMGVAKLGLIHRTSAKRRSRKLAMTVGLYVVDTYSAVDDMFSLSLQVVGKM